MDRSPPSSSGIALLLVALLVLATVPGVAAAESRAGGTVVVAEGETIDEDLEAFGGTIIVRGTVNGDLSAFGGNVVVEGEVTGDVEAFAGNVRIAGTVGGDVDAVAGNVDVDPGSEIGGSLSAAAGNVVVAGSVGGNAELAGGTVTLAESAAIDGNVEYGVESEEDFRNEGAAVGGLLFALLLWVALVYGRFAIGAWLLSLADVENRWLALVVGLLLLGLAALIPWIGGLVNFVVILLGLGAVTALGYTGYRERRA